MTSILIRNGRVIDPASGRDGVADVAIRDGRIVDIGPGLSTSVAGETVDADGLLVTPGLIDPHVHLREPGQQDRETIASGTAAAVRGGFTTVCCMPNTAPAIDSPEIVEFVLSRARSTGHCRVFPVAAATVGRAGERLTDSSLLAAAGAIGFSDDGDAVASAGVMAAALAAAAETGLVFMQHCQDPTLTDGASMHAGDVLLRLGLRGWPRVAEEIIVERDIRLALATSGPGGGARYHVQHISSAGSVEIVGRARQADRGRRLITAEASPHHLLLTHEACKGFNTLAKMNPPLREDSDRQAIRQAVADGVITVLATDHAPHTPESKATDFESASFGIVGLETALALYAEALVYTGAVDWPRLIALLTIEPARLCGLDARGLGRLEAGGPADLTLIDPDAEWTVRAAEFAGRGRNTPFEGRRVRGRAVRTIVAGRTAWALGTGQA